MRVTPSRRRQETVELEGEKLPRTALRLRLPRRTLFIVVVRGRYGEADRPRADEPYNASRRFRL